MENCIDMIKKKISKLNNNYKGWIYVINLKSSCICPMTENYYIIEARIIGEGNIDDLMIVEIKFKLTGNINEVYTRRKKLRGVENAILYIWNFQQNHHLCLDCCQLNKNDSECENCIFYKSFMIFNNIKQLCGICQEETYRIQLNCNHFFHRSCLLKLDPNHLKCPLCRHPLDEDVIVDLFDDHDSDSPNYYISDDED